MTPADHAIRLALRSGSPAGWGGRLSIMIFHRVFAEPDPLFPGEPDRRRFDEVCGWIARWFNVLPLDEAVAHLSQRSLPARALAITFDDGYADNFEVAMPLLKRHGLSATFFIATAYLDGGRMWNDTVVESIRQCATPSIDLSGLGLKDVGVVDLSSNHQKRAAIGRLLPVIKYLPSAKRQSLAEEVASACRARFPSGPMMTSLQVRMMADAGMQIGAHTMLHPILAELDDDHAWGEITQSKARLENLLDRPVTLFAYPNGLPNKDYRRRDVDLDKKAGFQAAVSTASGAARSGTADPFQLPRFTPWDRASTLFGVRMLRNLSIEPDRCA